VGLSYVSNCSLFPYLTHNYPPRYLPPPILEILSDKTLEAAKQAEMITTALAWLFNNLPIDVFPPHMKPFLVLLRLLIPRTTYIGSLISWSWSWIMAYDVGELTPL
jgi:hypothetical protein